MNMSDQRHAKTVTPEYLGHRAALKASQ